MKKALYHCNNCYTVDSESENIDPTVKIKSFIKKALGSKNLSIFIGSGCSSPAIPLMSITMKELLKDSTISDIVEKYTAKDENDGFSDIEGLLNWLQNGMDYHKLDDHKEELQKIYDKIKGHFLESIINITEGKDDVLKIYEKFYNSIYSLRNVESNKLSIFTSNYDLFNERAFENNNISYTTGFNSNLDRNFDVNQFKYRQVDNTNRYKNKWQPVNKEANLFKLHGSINWIQDNNGNLVQNNNVDKSNNVVIYPTLLKHKETTQSPYSELFREFSNALQLPNTTLIVIGYGFSDDHINNIIKQNLNNEDFNLIIFGSKDEKNTNSFYQEYKSKINLHLIGGVIEDEMKNKNQAHHFSTINQYFMDSYMSGESDE